MHNPQTTGPNIATLAALVADPARAQMIMTLMDGRAFTATELARAGGVTPQTASAHLAKLVDGRLVSATRQGRHRYFCLSGPQIADMLEALGTAATAISGPTISTGPADAPMRKARVCYDHLAGQMGVALLDGMRATGRLAGDADAVRLTQAGEAALEDLGVDIAALKTARRPLCRTCLDWSERRPHLAGAIGAAILDEFLQAGWARRVDGSRALAFSPEGRRRFHDWLSGCR